MTELIHEFIAKYIDLSEEEIRIIEELKLIVSYKKNTVLLSEGELSKECYFILKGCLRSYYVIDGEEKTTEFFTEQQAVTPISYVMKQPSEYYLSCLEDSVIALGQKNDQLIERIPKLKTLIMQMNGELLARNQESFDHFKNSNPEERYRKLLETRRDLVNRVPQYQLASYLGITPESLSRIRKRLLKDERVN
jgi:CRP-like cAMP-binding protein